MAETMSTTVLCASTSHAYVHYVRLIYIGNHGLKHTHTNLEPITDSYFLSIKHLQACKQTHHKLPKPKHLGGSESTR